MKDKSQKTLQTILKICKENYSAVCIRTKVGMGLLNTLQIFYPDAVIYNCSKSLNVLTEKPQNIIAIFDGVGRASSYNIQYIKNIMDTSLENKVFVILTYDENDEVLPSLLARANHLNFSNEIHV